MDKYAKASVTAVRLLHDFPNLTPLEAWRQATLEVFPTSKSGREKSCPKGAFLGLCDKGLVRGVNIGRNTSSIKNKGYAIAAVDILLKNQELVHDPKNLWQQIPKDNSKKRHNSQMDVVCALWFHKMIL